MDLTIKGFATPKGLPLVQIEERFPTPEKAREYLEALHWPNGPVAAPRRGQAGRRPRSEAGRQEVGPPGAEEVLRVPQAIHRHRGDDFEDSHVPLNEWLIAVYLMCSSKKGMSAHQLHRMLGTTYKTAWFMFHRLRFAVRQPSFRRSLAARERSSRPTRPGSAARTSTGRGQGWQNKTTVFAMVERNGDVHSMPMGSVTASNLKKELHEHVDRANAPDDGFE